MGLYDYPELSLDPPEYDEEEPVLHCDLCGEPIYEGEDHWELPDGTICCDCCIEAMRQETIGTREVMI